MYNYHHDYNNHSHDDYHDHDDDYDNDYCRVPRLMLALRAGRYTRPLQCSLRRSGVACGLM